MIPESHGFSRERMSRGFSLYSEKLKIHQLVVFSNENTASYDAWIENRSLLLKKILDHKIGDYLYEKTGDETPFTAGRIVAMSESTARKDVIYVLLRTDAGEYTVYSALSEFYCAPCLARFIPHDNLAELFAAMDCVLPDVDPEAVLPAVSVKTNKSSRRRRVEDDDATTPVVPDTPVDLPPPEVKKPSVSKEPKMKVPESVDVHPGKSSKSDDSVFDGDNIFNAILADEVQ